jgi:uncharacterized membrane protein
MSSLGEGVDVSRPRDLVAESGVGDEIRAPEGADQAFERSLTDASDDDPAVRRAVGQTNTSFVDHHHLVVLTRVLARSNPLVSLPDELDVAHQWRCVDDHMCAPPPSGVGDADAVSSDVADLRRRLHPDSLAPDRQHQDLATGERSGRRCPLDRPGSPVASCVQSVRCGAPWKPLFSHLSTYGASDAPGDVQHGAHCGSGFPWCCACFRRCEPPDVPADLVVLASGVVEIALGGALLTSWNQPRRAKVGAVVAAFFVAVFPGNVAQFTERRDAFGLDSDTKRFVRLLFQPALVACAVAATDARRVLLGARRSRSTRR